MTIKTDLQLIHLEANLNAALDRLHDELLARLETMARSVGQKLRVNR